MPAVPGGRPARPAGRHQGRPPPPPATAGRARGHRPGPPRARPCRPSPPAGPGRPHRPAAQPARGAFPLSPFPGPAAPGRGLPPPARRGPDLTRRAERSVRRRGPTDGPPPGTRNRSRPAPRHPGRRPRNPGRPAADDRGGDRRAAGIPGRLLPLAPARRRPGGGAAAGRRGAGPAQRADARGCAAWKRHARRTGARQQMDSYDVRFWDIKKLGNGTGARFRVRWAVDGREHCKSFKARPLADGFLDGLKDAVRDRRPFNPRTGLPEAETTGDEMVTWYAARPRLRRGQVAEPRPGLPPVGRRGPGHRHRRPYREGAGRARAARCCGRRCSPGRSTPPPATATRREKIAAALGWAERASLPVAELEDTATVRLALGACAKTLTGKAAAGSTQRRKRSVFYNALGYAVEQGHLPSNPVDRIQWTTPAVAASVDRRVVVSPAQARSLLAAVRALQRPGAAPGGVLRLPVLRRAAPVGGGHAPRGRPVPAEEGVGEDRPGRLRLPGGHGLDRPRHRPAGTRPEAPRRQRDKDHPHPARTRPAAARPHQAVRHDPGRADLPDRPGRHPPGLRLQRGLDRGPQAGPHPRPVPAPRSAAAPTTCGTRRSRCG